MNLVVIGNGVAGMEAALAVREHDPSAQLTIVSEESDNFFSRTALMWVLCGQMSHRDIEPLERDAYERFNFRRVRDRVRDLNPSARQLSLACGGTLKYDKLLIACGSKPRRAPWPGSDAVGVGHFVTLQDLEWLEHELHGEPSFAGRPPNADALQSVPRSDSPYQQRKVRQHAGPVRPSVVGGGLIGIEAIECFVAAGLTPDFFIREEWFWPMALDHREANWIKSRLEAHGVRVHLDHEVERMESTKGELSAIITNQARYESNLCVVAIGVVPNTAWLSQSSVQLDEHGGILVDAHQQTSETDIYAAGDCASVRWASGRVAPEQLWYTSREQGRVAAHNLVGEAKQYERGVWYNSAKFMDIEYTTVGDVHDRQAETFFYEETGDVRSTTRILSKAGRVTGFNLLGRRWEHNILMQWIDEGRALEWVRENISAASFDSEFVPPLVLSHSRGEAV